MCIRDSNIAGLPNILIGIVLVLLISASVSTRSIITLTACSTAGSYTHLLTQDGKIQLEGQVCINGVQQ